MTFNIFNPTASKTIDLLRKAARPFIETLWSRDVQPQAPTTEQRFVERVVDAVTSDNLPQLRQEIVIYSELLGLAAIEHLMGEAVTLALDVQFVPRYLGMMTDGGDLNEVIQDLLAEVSKTLIEAGLIVGKDFSYGEDPDVHTPFLRLTPEAYSTASDQYTEAAWKQCVPFLKPVG
jgi:hypothetical protein